MGGRPCRYRAGPRRHDLIAKIADTVPERLRPFVLEPASRARPRWHREPDRIDMARTRAQIHEGKKIALRYRDEHGRDSERTIWPIAIGYHEAVRILAAWCELRRDFRSFRTDRVDRCRPISTRNIRSGATCSGRDGAGAWSGNSRAIPDARARWPVRSSRLRAKPAIMEKHDPAIDCRKPLPGLRRVLLVFVELAALHHRGRCGARFDSGKVRQRQAVGHALRRRTAARRCQARSAWRRRAGFMRCGPRSAGPACPAMPNARWREDGTACRRWRQTSRMGDRGVRRLRRDGFGEIFVELVFDRRERAERLGRERDRLAVAVGRDGAERVAGASRDSA